MIATVVHTSELKRLEMLVACMSLWVVLHDGRTDVNEKAVSSCLSARHNAETQMTRPVLRAKGPDMHA